MPTFRVPSGLYIRTFANAYDMLIGLTSAWFTGWMRICVVLTLWPISASLKSCWCEGKAELLCARKRYCRATVEFFLPEQSWSSPAKTLRQRPKHTMRSKLGGASTPQHVPIVEETHGLSMDLRALLDAPLAIVVVGIA